MKNKKLYLILLAILLSFCLGVLLGINIKSIDKNSVKNDSVDNKQENKTEEEKQEEIITKSNLVSYNGWLSVEDNTLVNSYHEKIQLKGMSTHGIQWYGEFANESMIKSLRDEWNSNVFRIAMYTDENGYIQNRDLKNKLIEIVDTVIKLDMYVIVDWHILSDGNPNTHINEAKEFFNEISNKYKDVPNVIYEICNEPNGNVTWYDIKLYAEQIIPIIRNNTPNSIIVVGTPTWSQDVDKIDKINDKNTMYSLHFYSGTHKDDLRNRVKSIVNEIPIFVTEWGTSDASGDNGVYLDEARKWIDFMNENNISWTNWSLSDKNESSALLLPNSDKFQIKDENLSESGKFVKEVMLG